MRWVLIAALLALVGCSRPMTERELAFADALFGPSLDTDVIRVSQDLGLLPPMKTEPDTVRQFRATDQACVRVPQPRAERSPEAFALRNRVHLEAPLYSSDHMLGWPYALRVPQALVFAHELTHVWQFQNRATTGYSALGALGESLRKDDPYFFDPQGAPEFFQFGFEQQAAIVEDWVCFTVVNPGHPRRLELRALLEPVLPVHRFEKAIQRDAP